MYFLSVTPPLLERGSIDDCAVYVPKKGYKKYKTVIKEIDYYKDITVHKSKK